MCTVTFIPTARDIYLTSNRDERFGRAPARFPFRSGTDEDQLLYPKDGEAGGSWIALMSRRAGDAAVLLNGAFVKHIRWAGYRQSRGLIFLEIARAADPLHSFRSVMLDGIESFTLILFIGGRLFECRWDGMKRYVLRVNHESPQIWSSATLYDEAASKNRQRRFEEWYGNSSRINEETIMDFHRSVGRGTPEGGRIIDEKRGAAVDRKCGAAVDRQEKILTVSITSIRIAPSRVNMSYVDLLTGKRTEVGWRVGNRKWFRQEAAFLQRLFIRMTAWEYWPFAVVYGPVLFYWVWLSLKARSWFFFSTANPSIKNAGFLMESKQQIYDLMPEGSYPKTLFCPKGRPVVAICRSLEERNLVYPLIAKPDIGQRGMKVSLLRNECELYLYSAQSKVDFLLQEYIAHPHEAGIFYYRLPGDPKGRISGIVGKEMLKVVGDGRSTIETLLGKNDRYVLQLPVLYARYGEFLQQVPAAGEEHLLVPYGNHSRGAKFLDWSDRSTPALEETIDRLCRQVPGFYFGRLDIKFAEWEELCEGRGFSVIELNGAGSEPTHMYDPRHSIFFAWKEILRHWRLLSDISRDNARVEGLAPMSTIKGLRMLRDYARYEKLIS